MFLRRSLLIALPCMLLALALPSTATAVVRVGLEVFSDDNPYVKKIEETRKAEDKARVERDRILRERPRDFEAQKRAQMVYLNAKTNHDRALDEARGWQKKHEPTLSVRVLWSDPNPDRPIAGATIILRPNRGSDISATTDNGGRTKFKPFPPGTYTLIVEARNFEPFRTSLSFMTGHTDRTYRLANQHPVWGTVVTILSAPADVMAKLRASSANTGGIRAEHVQLPPTVKFASVVDARVTLFVRAGQPKPSYATTTKGQGFFEIPRVRPASYGIQIEKAGLIGFHDTLNVNPRTQGLRIILLPAVAAAAATDPDALSAHQGNAAASSDLDRPFGN